MKHASGGMYILHDRPMQSNLDATYNFLQEIKFSSCYIRKEWTHNMIGKNHCARALQACAPHAVHFERIVNQANWRPNENTWAQI